MNKELKNEGMKELKNEGQKQEIPEAQERLLDIFAAIENWTRRGENHAFVFLCDGDQYLLFANQHDKVACNLPSALLHNPQIAACFSLLAGGAEVLFDSMSEDEPTWKEEYDKIGSYRDMPEHVFYGGCFKDEEEQPKE